MAPFTKNAGRASALMGAIQLGIGAFTSALVSFLHNDSALPMSGVMAACAVLSYVVLLTGRRAIYKSLPADVEEKSGELITTL